MLAARLFLALGLAATGLSSVLPAQNGFSGLVARAPTPDNSCGGAKGYTCVAGMLNGGPCCSKNGFCGSTAAYCGTGCQTAFGTCTASPPAGGTGNTGQCGPSNGNAKCVTGMCCSVNGWCGNTAAYCAAGCQPGFGNCGTPTDPTQPTKTGASTNGRCGSAGNNSRKCPGTQCCSIDGWCGTGPEFCEDPDCQWQYGTCDSSHTPAGPSTLNDPRPKVGKIGYGTEIWDCIKNKQVGLTFDDGPGPYTATLLDILKKYKFHATFFVSGNNLNKGPIDTTPKWNAVIKRMVAEGHQVASHTWSHYDLSAVGHDQRVQQMVKNERALANILGKYPTYMRPPYSSCTKASGCMADMATLGYHITYFDLDTQDYLNDSPILIGNSKAIVKDYLFGTGKAATNYLAIQHDIHDQSVHNLTSFFLDDLVKKGWKGVTAGECLEDPEVNWYRTKASALK